MLEEQISSTLGTQILCLGNKSRILYGTRIAFKKQNLINTGNKNIARNTSFLTPGTRILLLRNTSRLLKEQDYYIEEQIACTKKTRILRPRNKSRLLRKQNYCVRGTKSHRHNEQKKCVRGTNLIYPGNTNIVSGKQISSTIWNKNCVRGTNLVNTENKNIATRNTSFLTPGTRILLLINISHLLKEQDYYIEEQIVCTKKTRILRLRNKSRLLRKTRLLRPGNKISSTQGKKKCSRNKSHLPWEHEYCVQGTNLVYYMEQELRPRNKSRAVTQHTTACCSMQVVDITLAEQASTNITSLRMVQ
jgi:hypothetical protein